VGVVLLIAGLLGLWGCTQRVLPSYIHDKYPYIRRFHASYEEALTATRQILAESGWVVEQELNPVVYEHRVEGDLDEQCLMIITEEKNLSRWLGKRKARMNLFLQSKGRVSELEIRIIYKKSFRLWSAWGYRQDKLINKIFARAQELLTPAD
jgi:hypothetical protein